MVVLPFVQCGRILWRMRQSQLFTKTRREAPANEVAKNAQLLIRAGYVHKELAGVYDFLPLGLRVLNKVIGNALPWLIATMRSLMKRRSSSMRCGSAYRFMMSLIVSPTVTTCVRIGRRA